MEKYCRNCGSKIKNDAKFCQECGEKVENVQTQCPNCGETIDENAVFCPECGQKITESICPVCGESIEDAENFCENCGTGLKASENKLIPEKYKRWIIPAIIMVIALIGVSAALTLSDTLAGTQVVSHDSLDLKIPANFEYNSTASNEVIDENVKQKVWSKGDEEIEIAIIGDGVENRNPDATLASLGGSRTVMYGISGFHNKFQNGEEAFSFGKDNKIYSIMVSNGDLFDKIEIV